MDNILNLSTSDEIRIFKNSDKYLIFSGSFGSEKYVYKIAHKNSAQLLKEIERIRQIGDAYSPLKQRMPAICSQGTIETGIHAGKAFYVQRHVPGMTFSHFVQHTMTTSDKVSTVERALINRLTDIALGHTFASDYDNRSGRFMQEVIWAEYERLHALKNVSYLNAQRMLSVDGQAYSPLKESLERIFSSARFAALDDLPSFISTLGHWNFHGDNIILESSDRINDFKVIDPDVNIEKCDPLFGLARFLYSFPHDTVDYRQYIIRSKMLTATDENEAADFRITYLWPQVVYCNYASLFKALKVKESSELQLLDSRFEDPLLLYRLKICMLYCLLRGVCANYEEVVEFVDGDSTAFRNKSMYLFLQLLMFSYYLANNND